MSGSSFIGLCHSCYCSNLQTELVEDLGEKAGLPLCLKCKILYEVNSISDTSSFDSSFDPMFKIDGGTDSTND